MTMLVSVGVLAGAWNGPYRPNQGPDKSIQTLVVTANYLKPRLLVDLIQYETKQPIMLLPTQPGGMIFFLPANGAEAQEIDSANFAKFIKFVNPKRILIIGDERFVSDNYVRQIDPNLTVWRVKNKDWKQVAEDAEDLLRLNNLARDFRRLSDQIDSGRLYAPGAQAMEGVPQELPPAMPEEQPVVMPEPEPVAAPIEEPVIIQDDVVIPK